MDNIDAAFVSLKNLNKEDVSGIKFYFHINLFPTSLINGLGVFFNFGGMGKSGLVVKCFTQ